MNCPNAERHSFESVNGKTFRCVHCGEMRIVDAQGRSHRYQYQVSQKVLNTAREMLAQGWTLDELEKSAPRGKYGNSLGSWQMAIQHLREMAR